MRYRSVKTRRKDFRVTDKKSSSMMSGINYLTFNTKNIYMNHVI